MTLIHQPLDADVACQHPSVVIALAFVLVTRENVAADNILIIA